MKGRGRSRKSLNLVAASYAILQEIQPASVRAVCYKLFTIGQIRNMSKGETDRVSHHLTVARENGDIPWEWIVDSQREPRRINVWENPAQYFDSVSRQYRRDRWADQPERVEVWSEKGTISGTLEPVLQEYGVTFRVLRGYGSATAIMQAAQDSLIGTKLLTVLYVGDWDPSGLNMSEVDIPARFVRYGGEFTLERVALTIADATPALPSFDVETKRGDSRYRWFRERFGTRCWELDALSPVTLRERIERRILDFLDMEAWRRADIVETAERDSIASILSSWPGISGQASK